MGIPHFCVAFAGAVTAGPSRAAGSARGLGVWIPEACFRLVRTSVRRVRRPLGLVFSREHLPFEGKPRRHHLPAGVAVERFSARNDLLQIFHARGTQRRVERIQTPRRTSFCVCCKARARGNHPPYHLPDLHVDAR